MAGGGVAQYQAPVPFFFGVHSSVRATIDPLHLREIVVVDLDAGTVVHEVEGWSIGWSDETQPPSTPRSTSSVSPTTDGDLHSRGNGDDKPYYPGVDVSSRPSGDGTTTGQGGAGGMEATGTGADEEVTPTALPRNPEQVNCIPYLRCLRCVLESRLCV